MRKSSKVEAVTNTRLYDSLWDVLIGMATSKDSANELVWLGGAWVLFDSVKRGTEVAVPNATALATWLRCADSTLVVYLVLTPA